MTSFKIFYLNGQSYCVKINITLLDLINYFDFNESLLVLEYNNLICEKKNWGGITLKNQDRIEIVTIVGGG